MKILDANLLLYAYDASSPFHAEARLWLETLLSGNELIGIPWQSVGAFLRVVTHPKLPGRRYTPEEAIAVVESWIGVSGVRMLGPGERHGALLRDMIVGGQARGALITDAHLAALTIEYGGYLCTTDRDFGRFGGLRWGNPLTQRSA